MSQTFVFRARHAEQADFMRFALSFVTLVRPGWHVFDQRSDFAKVFAGFSRTWSFWPARGDEVLGAMELGFCVGKKQFSDDKVASNSKDEVEVNDGVGAALP
jgi:hypothetical protein